MYKASGASLDPLQQIMTMATLAENNIMRKNEVVKTKLEPDLSQTRRVYGKERICVWAGEPGRAGETNDFGSTPPPSGKF